MTPTEWYVKTIGKSYDVDGYYGAQCWDYFAYFCKQQNMKVNLYCSLTGYAGDLWKLRNSYGYDKYFDFITDINQLKNGDWVFWNRHVAMYYNGKEIGQNQSNKKYVTAINLNKNGFLGAMRWRGWSSKNLGVAECYSKAMKKTYYPTVPLNLRMGGSLDYDIIVTMPIGTKVTCYGYFHMEGNVCWVYGVCNVKGKQYTGFCVRDYLGT